MEDEKVLLTTDEAYIEEIPDTVEEIVLENPDDREYEQVEIEVEGGR